MNAKDGSVLVRVPAGEFEMGDGLESDCPRHRVRLDEYWIGVYAVTNRQYARFVEETMHRVPDHSDLMSSLAAWRDGQCPEEKLDHPVVCVSWDDAQAYGDWAGLALPTEAQWERAARGPQGLLYPWGKVWDPSRCRNGGNEVNEGTAPVWEYAKGASAIGTYQQSGNVWEWCADWYWVKYYAQGPSENPRGPSSGAARVLRGGGWRHGDASTVRGAHRFRHAQSRRFDDMGFRLVRTGS